MSSPAPTRKRKIEEVDLDNGEKEALEEEKVLSHAAQRRLRKRQKTAMEDPSPNEEVGSKGVNTTKNTGRHSVWVGNIAFKTTPQSLRAFFGDAGGEITRVHMPTKSLHGIHAKSDTTRGDNKGFAYVDFATLAGMEAAIAMSERNLDGRKLLIKDGGDFAGRPEKDGGPNTTINPLTGLTKTARKILSQQKNPACQTLFLGNLSFETTEAELAALFGRTHPKQKSLGSGFDEDENELPLVKVRMGTFEDSGKCKGFSFVDFKNIQSATDALINPRNHSLNGRALVVEFASADAVRRGELAKQTSNSSTPKSRASRRPQKSERIAAKLARTGTVAHTIEEASEEQVDLPLVEIEKVRGSGSRPQIAAGSTAKAFRLKPGASLANAKREQVAIVESTGKKITFS